MWSNFKLSIEFQQITKQGAVLESPENFPGP